MKIEDIIGKQVTNIYVIVKLEFAGIDEAKCYIELDKQTLINMPYITDHNIQVTKLPTQAVALLDDVSDYPVKMVNKEGKTIEQLAEEYKLKNKGIFNKMRNLIFSKNNTIPEDYQPHEISYEENELKHIKDQKIVDFIWYLDDSFQGYLLLENGYIITEIIAAPHGTGSAGLKYYKDMESLKQQKGSDFLIFSQQK